MMKLLSRLLREVKQFNWILTASILSGIAATLTQLAIIMLGFWALTGRSIPIIWVTLIALALVTGFTRFGEQYLGHLAAFKILANLRGRVYQKGLELAPAKLDDHHSSQLLKLLAQDIEQVETFYAHTLGPVVITAVVSIIQVVGFAIVNPLLGLIAAIGYAVIGIGLPIMNQRQLATTAKNLEAADAAHQSLATETVTGRFELQQYQAVSTQLVKLASRTSDYWQASTQKLSKQLNQGLWMQLALVASLVIFAVAAIQSRVSLVVVLTFPFTFGRVMSLASLPGSLSGGLVAARHLFDFLDEKPVVPSDTELDAIGPLTTVDLAHISFAYPKRPEVRVLKDVQLNLKKPVRIGIIGKSGQGKSTIVKLIMRWYPILAGQLTYNRQASEGVTVGSVRSQINYVSQVPKVFAGSIRENLTLRDDRFTDDQIWKALGWVRLKEVVSDLPKQLETRITEAGRKLSAGETQRLELARALLHPSSMLILDEPTSNLDTLNEAMILAAVKAHYSGIVIIVTHRQSSLATCDRVYELNDGQLKCVNQSG